MSSESTNYQRIETAINYIISNFRSQPSLDDVAAHVHLSPYHFQKLFTDWAGVSPKQFLQYISISHAKKLLAAHASLADAAFDTGLSGSGRLHDMFVKIEGMTPGEYKNGGEGLHINYSFANTPFGKIIIASTTKGICHISFAEHEAEGLDALQAMFPNASLQLNADAMHNNALGIFHQNWEHLQEIKLHLKGTPFQIKVWETLLKIPAGNPVSYNHIARALQQPTASRAVGSAVGDNPVAYLIPCHRVIRADGNFGQYHWGSGRKTAMLGWEAAQNQET